MATFIKKIRYNWLQLFTTSLLFAILGLQIGCSSGSSSSTSSQPTLQTDWVKQLGATEESVSASNVVVSDDGSVYITGFTTIGLESQTQNGQIDCFIARYSPSGNLIWLRQLGSSSGITEGIGISIKNHAIYITGSTTVALDEQTQNGEADSFIAKYDESGTLFFVRQLGASGGNTVGNAIDISNDGDVYIAGETDSGLESQTQNGTKDSFLAKYNSVGDLVLVRQLGGSSGITTASGIKTSEDGNVYIGGSTTVGLDNQVQLGIFDGFLAKYSSNGDLDSVVQLGSSDSPTGFVSAFGIALESNNVYLVGFTTEGLDGQTQIGVFANAFLAKYDANESLVFVRQVGRTDQDTVALAVSVANDGNVYISGSASQVFESEVEADKINSFIARYSTNGNLTQLQQFGNLNGITRANGVSAASDGSVYLTGSTTAGLEGQIQNGNIDAFLQRLVLR